MTSLEVADVELSVDTKLSVEAYVGCMNQDKHLINADERVDVVADHTEMSLQCRKPVATPIKTDVIL